MISPEELNQIGQVLAEILQNDDATRKAAEAKLSQAKRQDADRYACYLVAVMHPSAEFSVDIKSLAAVILRRSVSCQTEDYADHTDAANNANLWMRLSDPARVHFKAGLLECLRGVSALQKHYSHKICNLIVEVQGSMYEHEDN